MRAIIIVMPSVQAGLGVDRADAPLPYTPTMCGFALGDRVIGRAIDRLEVTVTPDRCEPVDRGELGYRDAVHFGLHSFSRELAIGFGTAAGLRAVDGGHLALVPETARHRRRDRRRRQLSAQCDLAVATRRCAWPSMVGAVSTSCSHIAGFACCMAMSMPQAHIVSLCIELGFGPAVGAEMLSLMLFGGVASVQCIALFLYLPNDGLLSLYIVSLVFGLSQSGIGPSYAVIVREYLAAGEA